LTTPRRRLLRALPFVLAAVSLLPGLGLKDPWPADEPRYALVAAEMLAGGDGGGWGSWLVPVRAGEPYSDKPPLFFWLEAATLAATGSIRLAHQLPSLLAALATLLLVHDLARRLWNRRVALWAAAILLTTVQFTLQARSGQIDATLTLFTTLGLYGLLRHLLLGPAWGWYVAAFAAMGLGVMTKGVGFLPLLVFLPFAWAAARGWQRPALAGGRPWRAAALWALGPLAFAAVLAAWLLPLLAHVAASGDPALAAYRDDLLFRQTVERYADSWGHVRPAWYYVTSVLPWAWLPTTLALPWLLPAWRRRLARGDARQLLLLGWIALVLAFFSLSAGKRGVYLLPTAPALALAAAPLAAGLWQRRRLHWAGFAVTLLVAAAGLVVAALPGRLADAGLPPLTGPGVAFAALAVAAAAAARPRRGLVALVATLAGCWAIVGLWVYPRLDPARSGSELMAAVEAELPAGDELALVGWREQMFLQGSREMTHWGFRTPAEVETRAAVAWLAAGERRHVLLPERSLAPCFAPGTAVATAHRRDWHLVSTAELTDDCAAEAEDAPPPIRYRSPLDRRVDHRQDG